MEERIRGSLFALAMSTIYMMAVVMIRAMYEKTDSQAWLIIFWVVLVPCVIVVCFNLGRLVRLRYWRYKPMFETQVLYLDRMSVVGTQLKQRGIQVIRLSPDEILDGGQYRVSPRGLKLAERASSRIVVIAHNDGTGLEYAKALPQHLRKRTLIVWDEYVPDRGMEEPYAELGFVHFCSRKDEVERILGFVREYHSGQLFAGYGTTLFALVGMVITAFAYGSYGGWFWLLFAYFFMMMIFLFSHLGVAHSQRLSQSHQKDTESSLPAILIMIGGYGIYLVAFGLESPDLFVQVNAWGGLVIGAILVPTGVISWIVSVRRGHKASQAAEKGSYVR